jgi:hypothetical protein
MSSCAKVPPAALRYAPDDAALRGRNLDPSTFADFNRLFGLL